MIRDEWNAEFWQMCGRYREMISQKRYHVGTYLSREEYSLYLLNFSSNAIKSLNINLCDNWVLWKWEKFKRENLNWEMNVEKIDSVKFSFERKRKYSVLGSSTRTLGSTCDRLTGWVLAQQSACISERQVWFLPAEDTDKKSSLF